MNKYSLIVKGMRCAACSGAVTSTLSSINGIENISVNLLTGVVEFSSEKEQNIDDIIAKINALGYEAQINKGGLSYLDNTKDFNLVEMITIAIFGILELYLGLANMLMENPAVPEYLNIHSNPIGFVTTAFILALPIMIVGFKFFIPGLKSLFKLKPTMESLVSIGSLISFIYSFVWMIMSFITRSKTEEYVMNTIFDSSVIVIVLVYLGKYIEELNNNKAKKEIRDLIQLLPTNANVIRDDKILSVCINDVKVGETIIVKEGERIPVDGYISKGECIVDKSAITGESEGIHLHEDDEVLMGSIVTNGSIEVTAVKLTKETTVNNILYLVSKAQISKSKKAKLIDKVSYYFVPIVLIISLTTFVFWIFYSHDFTFTMKMFISTLVVACPCSIGLAIPMANVNLSTTAIKNGFVYRNTSIVNDINKIDTFVFDKTGTLTDGKFNVNEIKIFNANVDVYSIIYSIESRSNHPIGKSIASYIDKSFKYRNIDTTTQVIEGYGIKATIDKDVYYLTNKRYLKNNDNLDNELLYLSKNDEILASISISDSLTAGAKELINELLKNGKKVYMLTGDSKEKAAKIAKELGIVDFLAEVFPNVKYDFIKKLKDEGRHVCYIGDGINDAPALSISDVSISPYMSSDIASSSSDVYLLNKNLKTILNVFKLSNFGRIIINTNLIWAFGYNIVAMIIATGVFFINYNVRLEPWMSALAMSLSSLCVVGTSLLIKIFKNKN
jgi:Cu+-exporting ATPase